MIFLNFSKGFASKYALYYHRQILNAIKKGEADKCSRLMRAHIEDVQQHYHGMLI
ncbi:FCD domain-containing protein [Aneurinibacillus migulanus]|uniref:FCD domain-containing protein n=1 Tax=Aneurinibacillus migulanus TaxID=47500 RepID=UPI0038994ACF